MLALGMVAVMHMPALTPQDINRDNIACAPFVLEQKQAYSRLTG